MIEHMQLGDMPKFCESVKTWLSDRTARGSSTRSFKTTAKRTIRTLSGAV